MTCALLPVRSWLKASVGPPLALNSTQCRSATGKFPRTRSEASASPLYLLAHLLLTLLPPPSTSDTARDDKQEQKHHHHHDVTMHPSTPLALLTTGLLSLTTAQSTVSGDGYTGYNLSVENPSNVGYTTANTNTSQPFPVPDVFLNATVTVEEISILVESLTARINLDLQVLSLLEFNAGVDLSIDSVELVIEDVRARVLLEARLGNLVRMVDQVLESIDLNPIIAELGEAVGNITDSISDAVGGVGDAVGNVTSDESALAKRSFELENNILFSINNFAGNTNTNRVLEQDGTVVNRRLNNQGALQGTRVVGTYSELMRFAGDVEPVEDDVAVTVQEWIYEPYAGITAYCWIYLDAEGEVVRTRIVAESFAGGSATISEDS